jgi:hypothetical protein
VQVLVRKGEGAHAKVIWLYINRNKCQCGYLHPFCSCGNWMISQEEPKPIIKWEKMSNKNLKGHLLNQKKFGIKLLRKDEQFLNEP